MVILRPNHRLILPPTIAPARFKKRARGAVGNIIKESSYFIDEFIAFVVVCECGYIRELRKPMALLPSERQSTLQEYASL